MSPLSTPVSGRRGTAVYGVGAVVGGGSIATSPPGGIATGGWSGSGETGVEMMALDSMTNEILILAVDERKAEFEQRFSKWGSAADAFKLWSDLAVKFIDNARGVKREPAK